MSKKPAKEKKISFLDAKKHGYNGAIVGAIKFRKQDKRAKPCEMYAVVFFPRVQRIGKACIWPHAIRGALANSAATAKAIFMDGLAPGQKWATYNRAGHRIRKVRIVDCGDALPSLSASLSPCISVLQGWQFVRGG